MKFLTTSLAAFSVLLAATAVIAEEKKTRIARFPVRKEVRG